MDHGHLNLKLLLAFQFGFLPLSYLCYGIISESTGHLFQEMKCIYGILEVKERGKNKSIDFNFKQKLKTKSG